MEGCCHPDHQPTPAASTSSRHRPAEPTPHTSSNTALQESDVELCAPVQAAAATPLERRLAFPGATPATPASAPMLSPMVSPAHGTPGTVAPHLAGVSANRLMIKVLGALEKHGMVDGFRLRHLRGDTVYFNTDPSGRTCANGAQHRSNNFIVKLLRNGGMQFRCFSDKCCDDTIVIGQWKDEDKGAPSALDLDQLTPQQRRAFDPAVMKQAAGYLADEGTRAKAEAFIVSYFNLFIYFIESTQPEILQASARTPHLPHPSPASPAPHPNPPHPQQVYYDGSGRMDQWIRRSVEGTKQVFGNTGDTFKTWYHSELRNTRRGYECKFYRAGETPNPLYFNLACSAAPCFEWSDAPFTEEELASDEYQRFKELVLDTICEQASRRTRDTHGPTAQALECTLTQHPPPRANCAVLRCAATTRRSTTTCWTGRRRCSSGLARSWAPWCGSAGSRARARAGGGASSATCWARRLFSWGAWTSWCPSLTATWWARSWSLSTRRALTGQLHKRTPSKPASRSQT
jgi:hypothetical protein